MPEKVVYIGGVGRVSFPDSMGDADIARTIQEKIIPQSREQQKQGSSTFGSTFLRQAEERVGEIFAPVGQAVEGMKKGVQRFPQNPVAGAADVVSGAAGLIASPFTVATEAVKQIPVAGPHIAGAVEAPFKAIGQGLSYIAPPGQDETAQSIHGLNQVLAQFLAAGGAAKAMPKTGPKPLPDMSRAKSTGAFAESTGDVIPKAYRAEMIQKLVRAGERADVLNALPDAKLIETYKAQGLNTPAPLSEAPVSRGGDLSVRGPANEAQIAKTEVPVDPVKKVIDAIGKANPIREQQEKLYHLERVRRAGKLSGVYERGTGEQSLGQALATQKGELPKAQFEPIRDKLVQGDIDSMHDKVIQSDLSPYEKLSAQVALDKLFTKEGTGVPTKGELSLLEDVFGRGLTDAIQSKRANWQKIKDELVDAANVPRTVMSAFDMSMPFRQALIQTVSHPIKAAGAFKEMHKSFFSEKAFQEVKTDLKNRENSPLYKEFKLDILDADKQTGPLSAREESFTSHLAERIPFIGRGVRMSERAAYTYTNKVRADIFDMYANELKKQGITPEKNPAHYTALAHWLNVSTGRGSFGSMTRYAPTMSAVLFSPRLLASRFQALNPTTYAKMPKEVRVMALKDAVKFVGATTALLTVAKAGGAKIEIDPRSSDFGKIHVGNTRIDPWGGFVQIARLIATVGSGQRKTQDGKIVEMDNSTPYAGNRWETMGRFGESKLNPHIGFVVSWLKGKNFAGEKFELQDEAVQRLAPLYLQDAYDAMREDGLLQGFAKSAPGFYGAGTSTYKPKPGKSRLPSVPSPKVP